MNSSPTARAARLRMPTGPGPAHRALAEQGSAAIITVLMTGVTLAAIIAVTTQVSLGTRRTAADDVASARMLMAAESGMAGFLDRTRQNGVNYSGASNMPTMNTVLAQMVGGAPMNSFTVPGATISIRVNKTVPGTFATLKELTAVDVTSTATGGTDRSSVTQRFTVSSGNLPRLNIPGAVTSYPGVDLNGNASIAGQDLDSPDSAVYSGFLNLKSTSPTPLLKGTPVVMDASGTAAARLKSLQIGTYVRLPLAAGVSGVSTATTGLFRVDAKNADTQTVTLTPTDLPATVLTPFAPTAVTQADMVLNALTGITSTSMSLQNSETFIQGDRVSVRLAGVTYVATVSSAPVNSATGTTFTVSGWTIPPLTTTVTPPLTALTNFAQGQPVSKSTSAVVTAGSFDPGKNTPVGGIVQGAAGAAVVPGPMNNALFNQTFGLSPDELKSSATVITEAQFSANSRVVDGVTWLTSTDHTFNLNNEKVTGKGILVVDGDLNINQNQSGACDLNGVLYVRGNLRIQGNLQICGAIVVEGSILDSNNNVVAIDTSMSEFLGTGRKIQYDPKVLFDITQGSGKVAFTTVAGSWRQQ